MIIISIAHSADTCTNIIRFNIDSRLFFRITYTLMRSENTKLAMYKKKHYFIDLFALNVVT